jgi:hypothetical protein
VQDLSEGQECFLSKPQWRQLLSTTSEPIVVDGPPGLRLRAQLCGFLVDIPGLVEQATSLLTCLESKPGEYQYTDILQRLLAMRNKIAGWYTQEVLPLLRARAVDPDHHSILISCLARTPTKHDLLLAVNDCVANATIARLEQLLLQLFEAFPCGDTQSTCDINAGTIKTRIVTALEALDRVRTTSSVAAKPLEFGLRQLGFDTITST